LAHQLGKSWLFLASFDRGSQFNQGYGGPVFADSLYVAATWIFQCSDGRHRVGGAHRWCERPDDRGAALHDDPPLECKFVARCSRQWAFSAEYLRYSYDFGSGFTSLIGVPDLFRRNSLRGGVSMFLPITRADTHVLAAGPSHP